MRRKAVRKLLRIIGRLSATLRSWRNRLPEGLAKRPAAPRHAARAYGVLLDQLAAELGALETDVAAAEDAYGLARLRPTDCRRERDHAAAALLELYTPIQRLLGDLPVRGATILAATPDSPAALAHHLPLAVGVLRDLDRQPPWPVAGVRVDAGALADDLDAGLPPLDAALRALETAESELTLASCRADEAFERGERVVSWVATTLDGLRGLADS